MFLKNKNIIFKIRRSKVTDYAALRLPQNGNDLIGTNCNWPTMHSFTKIIQDEFDPLKNMAAMDPYLS